MTTAIELESMTITEKAHPPTLDELVERLGGIPLSRILARPAPGTATEADLLEAERRYDHIFELIEGVLVEKAMGFREAILAMALGRILGNFVIARDLGVVWGPDGTIRLFPGLIRIPDVAFASWDSLPGRKVPVEAMPTLAPDLAVEVISESNTPAEMKRKRGEFFASGVRIVWQVEPKNRTISVFTPEGTVAVFDETQTLDGGDILPGFFLRVSELFGELDRHG